MPVVIGVLGRGVAIAEVRGVHATGNAVLVLFLQVLARVLKRCQVDIVYLAVAIILKCI